MKYVVPDGPDVGREFVAFKDEYKDPGYIRFTDNDEIRDYNEAFIRRCAVPGLVEGRKEDSGKPSWRLFYTFLQDVEQVVKVLEFGAKKYAPDNWKKVPEAQERYGEAARRHILASMLGEENDPESGLSHEAHAIASLLFRMAKKRGL